MDDVKENISLEQLTKIENLSVRSANVCEWNELKDLTAILSYYWEYSDFLGLRNCGQKSNIELIELCKRYENFVIKPIIDAPVNPLQKQLENLTVRQKQILNNVINSQLNELSNRANNVLKVFTNSDTSFKGLYEIIINPDFDIKNFRNVGSKTEDELKDLFKNIRDQLELICVFNDEKELTIELFNTYLKRKFEIELDVLNEIFKNYNFENGLPLFKTLNTLVKREILFNNKEKEIFENGLNFWQENKAGTLEEIAELCSVTRERTRQIRNKLLEELRDKFAFIKGFELEALNLYGIDFTTDFIILTNELVFEINEKEKNTFNHLFINLIFSILYENSLKLVGNIESIAYNSAKARGIQHCWYSTYLISNRLFNLFDFEAFVNDIDSRLSERIEEDYSFHFETYLFKFLKVEYSEELVRIIPVTEHILFNEFEISVDILDNIVFKRNTIKQVYEYAYEALEALGEPSKVSDICKKVIEIFPDYNTDESSIRAAMQRKRGFISFGRTSTYGLKKWEEEKDIRGGTIRDITEEFLISLNEPKHINEITEYVNRYRETTAKNIYANLKMEENNRFVFFSGMVIGLKSKDYQNQGLKKTKNLKTIQNTWEESFSTLKSFINFNNRLPYSNCDEYEAKLYRFYNLQLRKSGEGKISEQKTELLNELIKPYLNVNRQRRNHQIDSLSANNKAQSSNKKQRRVTSTWWNSLQKLKEYLSENRQYPTATDDRSLYSFCYICNKKLEDGSLHELQIEALQEMDFTFNSENKKTWDEWFQELSLFWKNKNYWPKSSKNTDENEMSLYRFCNSVFKDFKNGDLNQNQIQKLQNISFPLEQGSISNIWLENYQKLIDFRKLNPNRWPQARGIETEKPLYQFCYRNKNKFKDDTLEPYKIQLLHEINFDFYG